MALKDGVDGNPQSIRTVAHREADRRRQYGQYNYCFPVLESATRATENPTSVLMHWLGGPVAHRIVQALATAAGSITTRRLIDVVAEKGDRTALQNNKRLARMWESIEASKRALSRAVEGEQAGATPLTTWKAVASAVGASTDTLRSLRKRHADDTQPSFRGAAEARAWFVRLMAFSYLEQ